MLLLSACGSVRPSADRLAELVESRPELVTPSVLKNRGFFRISGMMGPQLQSGECYEKTAVGLLGLAAGVDIVRVCFDTDGPIIISRHTHGCPWHEFYPNRDDACWEEPNFSEETQVRLSR
ncbi:hypothetical protein L0666_07935 [Octadecabacter sp. CECT 8868]|uniref:hypothetical protein n=1 Tax=Octadecabacter algicola TaxID=2909342 RepID=UPI001F2EC893|nr:hypothetical protein [Octadecabacter algicola]MCF2904914.1 hypothetical protein [Octadecabacter algicola]